ncbi:uncharacterized protein LOC131644746 [Vicia villosa]|uniref:uncharacterized protein LOC131644746 n=1 Tax=Vicia villosa TaxID=3911 RepID=UPI00273B474D|nr:uncharacterized protein LOC131644746 [Vicia villosa]
MGVRCEDHWQWDSHVATNILLDSPELMQEAMELMEILGGISPSEGVADSMKWWPNMEGCFTVKSCCSLMRARQLEEDVEANKLAAINWVLDSAVSSKIKVFGWRFFLNRLPSKDQLVRRNVLHREEDKMCVMCSGDYEDLAHLCFLCPFAKNMWNSIGTWLDIMLEDSVVGHFHLAHFLQVLKGRMKRKKLCLIWLTTVSVIWNSRNNLIFNNSLLVLDDVILSIKMVSWIWLSVGLSKSPFISFYSWYQAPLEALKSV